MAVAARNRDVSTGKRKMSRLMFSQGKCGWLVPFQVVATVASVEIRRGGELSGMAIGVAVCASLELDLEQSVLAFWYMALSALETDVSSLQWIGA